MNIKIIITISILTSLGVAIQWILLVLGSMVVSEKLPGFRNYFLSFWLADLWLITTGTIAAYLTFRKNKYSAIVVSIFATRKSNLLIVSEIFINGSLPDRIRSPMLLARITSPMNTTLL